MFGFHKLFLNLPKPLFTKEGLFYDVAFSGFIGNILERVKNGERLWAIKLPPLFRKEEAEGDLAIPIYRKLISLTSLQKKGFFMMLLLVILLGIYLIELRTESIYLPLKSPLFRKEGGRGRFNYSNLFKINLPNPSLQKRGFFMGYF